MNPDGLFDFLPNLLAALGVLLAVEGMLTQGSPCANIKGMLLRSFLWVLGYGAMWAGKWVCASLLTEQNVIADALKNALGRTGAEERMGLFRVIWQNAQNYVNPMGKLLVLLLALVLAYALLSKACRFRISWRKAAPMLLLALYPFVWYIALRNHSMIHAYMTHRNLAVTVMAVCCAVSLCLEENKKGENNG